MPKRIPAEQQPYDRIKQWIIDKDNCKLSESDKAMFNRWDEADNLLRTTPRKKVIASILCDKFKISQATAYNDIANAQRLFGSMYMLDKNWWRNFVIEDILELIEKAKKDDNFKVWNAAHNNLIKAIGLDQLDNDLKIDPEIISQHNFFTVINIGGTAYKLDLDTFQNIPIATRNKIVKELDREITDIEAEEILKS